MDCDVGTASLCEAAPGPAKSQGEQRRTVGQRSEANLYVVLEMDAGLGAQRTVSAGQTGYAQKGREVGDRPAIRETGGG